jgi:RecA-family ATPase
MEDLVRQAEAAKRAVRARTAWRIEGTLREFPKFPPKSLWFDFPRHRPDESGTLGDLSAEDSYTAKGSPYKANFGKRKTSKERKQERQDALQTAFSACRIDGGTVTAAAMAEFMGVSEKTVLRHIDESKLFWRDGNEIGLK